MTASVIMNKGTRDGRRGRLTHKRYVTTPPPPYDELVSRLPQKEERTVVKKKDCEGQLYR
jgi:hypothetical protein